MCKTEEGKPPKTRKGIKMMCANEATVISTISAEEKRLERERRKKEFQKASIIFCEEVIGKKIADECKQGYNYLTIVFGAQEWDQNTGLYGYRMGIVKDGDYKYANGKASKTSDKSNPLVDLDIICQYLEQHCYKVTRYKEYYKEWCCGEREGVELRIDW